MSQDYRPRPDDRLVEPFFAGLDGGPEEEPALAPISESAPRDEEARRSPWTRPLRRLWSWLRSRPR